MILKKRTNQVGTSCAVAKIADGTPTPKLLLAASRRGFFGKILFICLIVFILQTQQLLLFVESHWISNQHHQQQLIPQRQQHQQQHQIKQVIQPSNGIAYAADGPTSYNVRQQQTQQQHNVQQFGRGSARMFAYDNKARNWFPLMPGLLDDSLLSHGSFSFQVPLVKVEKLKVLGNVYVNTVNGRPLRESYLFKNPQEQQQQQLQQQQLQRQRKQQPVLKPANFAPGNNVVGSILPEVKHNTYKRQQQTGDKVSDEKNATTTTLTAKESNSKVDVADEQLQHNENNKREESKTKTTSKIE